ncbi:MAG: hypothetical protein IPM47_00300 [Sphingobacteriales bacterium]|nr:MAG: hypothetical protein IPM47_00300 [Sphingobacteriales bacterium]
MGKIAAVESTLGKVKDKTAIIEPYSRVKEIAELAEYLHVRHEGWKEFYLFRKLKSGKHHFIRLGNKFVEIRMNKNIGALLGYLDLKHPGWNRFVIVEDRYEKRPYKDCLTGMLIKQGAVSTSINATNKLRLVVELTDTHIVVNEEEEATLIRYEFAKRGKQTLEIICEDFDAGSFNSIFGEAG